MPKLRIKGSFATDGKPTIDNLLIEGDCQTCGGTFDITIPYDLHVDAGSVQHVVSRATTDAAGARKIVAS